MGTNDLAEELRANLKLPAWAIAVSTRQDGTEGEVMLVVRVSPEYHVPVEVPSFYRGRAVRIIWR